MDTAKPLITLALQTEAPSGSRVWNLHTADGNLVGWTPTLPSPGIFKPGCWQYGTGHQLDVDFATNTQTVPLP